MHARQPCHHQAVGAVIEVWGWRRLSRPRRRAMEPVRESSAGYRVTLGHSGFVIGLTYAIVGARGLGEGMSLVGGAELYDSGLADIAWTGLQQGIFSHACAVINQLPNDADGAGDLIECALVSEPEAACPGATVLKWWTQ